jgi:Molybdenum cofactor biosynthesis enzyme
MKIAVYGAGKCGEYVVQEISTYRNSKIEVKLFIDNDQFYSGKQKCNLPVVSLDSFCDSYRETVECVLIAVSNVLVAQEMAVSLLNKNYKNIYLLPAGALEAELPLLNINGEFRNYIKHIRKCKPVLPYLEYHVSDYCNLKCKRCGHYSNLITEKVFPDIEEFEKTLWRLKSKFKNINIFRLMGGEPFANPELDMYVYKLREYFPYADIRVVSNGLLLPKASRQVINSIVNCGAVIDISQYPPTRNMIDEILEFAEINELKVEVGKKITEFFAQYSLKHSGDLNEIFSNCISKTCYFLRGQRLYLCPSVALTYENREFLGFDISEETMMKNSFDLIQGKEDGWDMLKKMSLPNDFCRYCTNVEWHKWSISKDIKKEDWFVK